MAVTLVKGSGPFPEVAVILGDPRVPDATKVDNRYSPEDLEAVARMKAALALLDGYRFTFLDDHARLVATLAAEPPAFVLNLCDTGFRNEASHELHVPALLEMLGIPYSGSPPSCLACCYDKALVSAAAAADHIAVPVETLVPGCAPDVPLEVRFPAFVKPSTGDGSTGITRESLVNTLEEARAYLARLRSEWPGRDAVVQEFLGGPEYAIALVGNAGTGLQFLPPLEVDYASLDAGLPRILSYESKTVPDSPYWRQLRYREARLDPATCDELVGVARRLFQRLGCRDYARFDFRAAADGQIKLLEVNPNPAWCWDGKLQIMAGFAGYDESQLFALILDAAQRREATVRAG